MLAFVALVAAADAPVALGVQLTGEAVRDEQIALSYRGESLGLEGMASAPLAWGGLEAIATVGYRRLGGFKTTEDGAQSTEADWIWWAPLSLTVGKRAQLRGFSVSAEAGPSYVFWASKVWNEEGTGYQGGKWGVLGEVGVRVPVGDSGPVLYDPSRSGRGVAITGAVGYRRSFLTRSEECDPGPVCGFDFSALRLAAGVVASF